MSDADSEPDVRVLAGAAAPLAGLVPAPSSDGLGKLMSRAEEEARLRGRGIVHPHDLALALTVTPAVAELLLRCGVLQQDWRDYINFILGVNEGARRARERTVGARVLFAERRHTNATELSESAQLLLADAGEMARQVAASVTVEHVLMACMRGHGGIAGGTLRYFGLTPARLADELTLAVVRRDAGIRSVTRPRGSNPVLLFGGGMQDLPVVQVHTALREAGRNPKSFTVVGITAATGTKSAALSFTQRWSQLPGCVRTLASISDRAGAHDTRSVQELLEADLVLLDGGQEVRLFDALAGTPAEAALVAACDAGVVLAGYSAGTSALGIGSLSDWSTGEEEAVPLFGWLPWVIENHASGSFSQTRLRLKMRAFPGHPGLAVPHDGTVLISSGWTSAFTLSTGYDNAPYLLPDPDSPPQQLSCFTG